MTRAFAVIVAVALLVAGCAPLATRPTIASTALASTPDTALGRQLEPLVAGHPGTSGFGLINEGRQAFAVRTALAEVAERSLDAQYFLWDADAVGTILLHRLIRAANRGVRVRLLIDDLYVINLDPRSRAINTEVALFVYSAPLARQLLELLERDFHPENSWRVVLEEDGKKVAWVTQESAEVVRSHRPPQAGFWRRFATRIVGTLPIRGQL